MQYFAQELVDVVIDHLATEPVNKRAGELDIGSEDEDSGRDCKLASVAVCGLVCKKWLPRSRFHLFSSTMLSNADDVESFFCIVDSSSSPVLSFIQSLDLDLGDGPLNDQTMTRLHNLPNLTSVRIRTTDGRDNAIELEDECYRSLKTHIPLLVAGCPLLSRFHLDLKSDIPFPILAHLVSSLPALQCLRIGGDPGPSGYNILDDDSGLVPQAGSFPSGLLTLEVVLVSGAELLFAWMLSLPVLPPLRCLALKTFVVRRHFPIASQPIEVYFQRAGRELETLSLSLWSPMVGPVPDEHSQFERRLLESASNLRVLKLTTARDPSAVPDILNSLPSSRLSELAITVNPYSENEELLPWYLIWEQMDHALSQPKFEALQRFAFEDSSAEKEDVSLWTEEARAAMPMANARGILYCRFYVE